MHISEVLAPMFSRGDLPLAVRLRRSWARWPAGAVFLWSDIARGYLSPDETSVIRADTVRGAVHIFEAHAIQAELIQA